MEFIPLPQLELARMHEQLGQLFARADPDEQALRTFLQFTLSLVNGSAAIIHRAGQDGLKTEALLLSRQAESWSDNLQGEIAANAKRAVEEKKAILLPLRRTATATILSVPFYGGAAAGSGCLSVLLLPGNHALEIFVAILQLLASNLGLWLQQECATAASAAAGTSPEMILLVAEIMEETNRDLAASLSVNRLRDIFQADTIIFATCPVGRKPQVMAISSLADFSRQSPAARLIQQVLDECQLHGRALAWPAADLPGEIVSPILRGLGAEHSAEHAVCLPVFDTQGKCSGFLLALWQTLAPDLRQEILAKLTSSARILGSLCRWLSPPEKSANLRFARLPLKKRIFIVSALLLTVFGLCCLPVRYSISANCVLMPRTTRYVVSQFDGILHTVAKNVGDKVQKGEKIAQLDGQTIELEIGSLLAEIGKSRKLQDVSMVAGQTASAQIARLEGERLTEKLKLLQLRSTMLSIQSPIDGVIIHGAVEKAEGGPVRKGQTLFEIAPLGQMIVELHISQEDFRYVAKDSAVQIRLDSYPGRTWTSVINTIYPKTEPRQGGSVFLAQCFLNNQQGELQPGMNGNATVASGHRPLVWVTLNKPWTALQKIIR